MNTTDLVLYLALAAGLTSIVFALLADRASLFRRTPRRDESKYFPFDAKLVGETFFEKSYPPAGGRGRRGNLERKVALTRARTALDRYKGAKARGGHELENAQQKLADSIEDLFKSFTREEYRSDEGLRNEVNVLLDEVLEASREEGGEPPAPAP